jgi:ABC-type lipoprotein release transport system permease subunit
LTGTGIVLGIGIAAALTRVLSAFLFGVDPIDPATYAPVSIISTATALPATYLPARRASQCQSDHRLASGRVMPAQV